MRNLVLPGIAKLLLLALFILILSINVFPQETTKLTVQFEHNKYDLTSEAHEILDNCYDLLKKDNFSEVSITGHTDSDGGESFNIELSKKRAEAVLFYLISKGISKDRITLQYRGESSPFTENESEDQKQLNRRVEIIVSYPIAQNNFKLTKQAQIFSIKAARDTTLVCAEGTMIRVKANSFVSKSKGKAVSGIITFSVTEFYKLSDMMLADLSTTSDGELLETGGMLYTTASVDGEDLKLKNGEFIEISFPTQQKETDMQLFTGAFTEEAVINWKTLTEPEREIFTVVEEMPEFTAGNLFQYLQTNLKYPARAREMGVQGTVYISFIVTDKGKVINPRILRGVMPELDDAALNVLKGMPDWKPGKQRGENVNVQYNLPIRFSLNGESGPDTLIDWRKNYREEFERVYTDTTIQQVNSGTILYYMFSSAQLGWLNVDRFIKKSKPINYIVESGKDTENVKIIFDRYRSIMEGMFKNGNYTFNQVPEGEDITIVAIRRLGNNLQLAVKQSNTSQKLENDLVFLPVTMDVLKSEMKKLDRFR